MLFIIIIVNNFFFINHFHLLVKFFLIIKINIILIKYNIKNNNESKLKKIF